jgi:PEP-CTERM motif
MVCSAGRKTKMLILKIIVLSVFSIGFASMAHAGPIIPAPGTQLIYDAFGPNNGFQCCGGWVVSGFFPGIQSGEVLAAAFTPNMNVTFADAWLPFSFEGSGVSPSINVFLESGSGGLPSGILATLALNFGQLTGTSSILGFGCGSDCPALTQGTQYWLVAQQTLASTSDLWNETTSTAGGGVFAYNLLDSGTGPWSLTSSTTIFSGSPAFAVDGVTPEPSTLILFGSGLISIVVLSRRKLFAR